MKKLLSAAALLLLLAAPVVAQVIGAFPYFNGALSGTVVSVKPAAGAVAWINCYNPNATIAYVQGFDSATAVTLGVTVPKVAWAIQPQGVTTVPVGFVFFNSLKVAATTTASGSTSPASALVCNLGFN